MASGYTYCACRDCMDIAVSNDMSTPDLCEECKDADCVRWVGEVNSPLAANYECQREDAYLG